MDEAGSFAARAANKPLAKFSQSRRRPLLGGNWDEDTVIGLADLRHYANQTAYPL